MKMRPKENITIWEEDESLPQHMSPTPPPTHYSQPEHVPPSSLSPSPLVTSTTHQQKTPGTLSLHEYRKHLSHPGPDSHSPAPSSDISNSEGQKRRLRRKKRAANLYMQHSNSSNQDMMASRWYADPNSSVSSVSSSSTPPSLSSSYSVSALSQTQTQGSELDVDVSGSVQDVRMNSMNLKAGNGKNEDVSSGSPKDLPYKTHTKSCSDTILSRRGTTISHEGTPFQILNPRDSLRDARIVSFIEDVEYPSPRRHGFGETEDIIEEDAGPDTHGDDQKAHLDIMGDMPRAPIPSISSRLESERGSESAISPIIPSPNHPALNTRNESIRHYSHEQVSPLSSTAGISPHSDDTDLAYFHPLPNPTSYYPFTPSPSAREMGMGNIHSFYIHDPSPPPAEKKTGPRKLRKSRSAAVCTQEKRKIDVFRPFRRLREVVRGF